MVFAIDFMPLVMTNNERVTRYSPRYGHVNPNHPEICSFGHIHFTLSVGPSMVPRYVPSWVSMRKDGGAQDADHRAH